MRSDPANLDEAPTEQPAPMDDAQALSLARRLYGGTAAAVRRGAVLSVGTRKGRTRAVAVQGAGSTWEVAFDQALATAGR